MKTGKTLQELAAELERQKDAKADYIATSKSMVLTTDEETKESTLYVEGGNSVVRAPVTPNCHDQIADRLDIPRKYYRRMAQEQPELLQSNVNTWLQKNPQDYLLRTLDGNARAFLSSRYRPLDHAELAESVLPALIDAGAQVESCEITDTKMYLKAVTPRITYQVEKDDIVQAGVIISNSETGHGALSVEPLIHRLVCLNGMIVNDWKMRKNHLGARLSAGESGFEEIFTEETRAANDHALWLAIRDIIKEMFSEEGFARIAARMAAAKEDKIESDPVRVVELSSKRLGLSGEENNSVLQHLLRDGDLSRYGLANAVTRAAQDVPSYDRSTEMERLGGKIIELPRRDWQVLAAAA